MEILKSKYYDHPEGQDALGKMIATNKVAVATGLTVGVYDVLLKSKPKGYFNILGRYMYYTGPFVGMASAFTMTTFTATRLRGKDDNWNYVAGALSAGYVFGAWQRSVPNGGLMAIAFVAAALLKRLSINEGWVFFPEPTSHRQGSLNNARKNWSLMADRPKNWTTGQE